MKYEFHYCDKNFQSSTCLAAIVPGIVIQHKHITRQLTVKYTSDTRVLVRINHSVFSKVSTHANLVLQILGRRQSLRKKSQISAQAEMLSGTIRLLVKCILTRHSGLLMGKIAGKCRVLGEMH